jgi:rhodanese-related sulfurtransferase
MRTPGEAAVLLALTLAAATGTHYFHPRAPAWHEVEEPLHRDEVTIEMIERDWKNDVLWIDARSRGQFEKGHVPRAINLNEQDLEGQLIEHIALLQDNQKPVVIYCDSGGCQASRKIRDYLVPRFPTEEFYVLRGGWPAWEKENNLSKHFPEESNNELKNFLHDMFRPATDRWPAVSMGGGMQPAFVKGTVLVRIAHTKGRGMLGLGGATRHQQRQKNQRQDAVPSRQQPLAHGGNIS